jgi:hypothetical protein
LVAAVAITTADIALYRHYDGDLDGLSRSADRNANISDADWRIIDDLRQRAFVVAKGRGSEAFDRRFESDLPTHMPDERARIEFRELVEADLKIARDREA